MFSFHEIQSHILLSPLLPKKSQRKICLFPLSIVPAIKSCCKSCRWTAASVTCSAAMVTEKTSSQSISSHKSEKAGTKVQVGSCSLRQFPQRHQRCSSLLTNSKCLDLSFKKSQSVLSAAKTYPIHLLLL